MEHIPILLPMKIGYKHTPEIKIFFLYDKIRGWNDKIINASYIDYLNFKSKRKKFS